MIGVWPNAGGLNLAKILQTALAGCKVHLFSTAVTIGPGTTLAELVAAESAFSGYSAATVTALLAPYLDAGGGGNTIIGTVEFTFDGTISPPVTETVLGYWVDVTATGLWIAGQFSSGIPMAQAGNSLPLSLVLNLGQADPIVTIVGSNVE